MDATTPEHTGCCDPFDPAPWEDREVTWAEERFVTDRVPCFFHVPLTMGRVVVRNLAKITAAGAKVPHQLMLCDERTPWRCDIYINVPKDVPGATMATLSGTFRTKVFEGPYSMAGTWATEMRAEAQHRGTPIQKLYFSYTTCPRCATAYGKNYVVLFAQIA